MKVKDILRAALAQPVGQLEKTSTADFPNNGFLRVILDDTQSSLPGIEIDHCYVDAADCRDLAKFFKGLAKRLEAKAAGV